MVHGFPSSQETTIRVVYRCKRPQLLGAAAFCKHGDVYSTYGRRRTPCWERNFRKADSEAWYFRTENREVEEANYANQ